MLNVWSIFGFVSIGFRVSAFEFSFDRVKVKDLIMHVQLFQSIQCWFPTRVLGFAVRVSSAFVVSC